jgi:putative spermidine/putrescine transport system permease protein
MRLSPGTRNLLRAGVAITLAFIYVPLLVIALYAFNGGNTLSWPLESLTTEWFPKAIENQGAQDALLTSLKVGLLATAIALVLGSFASFAVARFRFFGRETISFLVILPIALPGIVTGVALSNTFTQVFGIDLSLFTVVVAHATFCIVLVYNNMIARLRRVSENLEEASADLGAHTWQTFRYVTLPSVQTALVAGGLLAFALSFDEIIVTTFTLGAGDQTLPIWIFSNLFRGQQLPIVNVVAVIVVLLSIIPVYLAHRLTREESITARGAPAVAETTAIP